jgi:metal-sulfur cluster biosynthetic enzyme
MTVVAESRVLRALDSVRDPELDEPITTLGFVSSVEPGEHGSVAVHLRLPTYFCAPNFAFLMVADAYDAVSAIDGVGRVEVMLDEHFASDAINNGVAAHAGFARSFDGEARRAHPGRRPAVPGPGSVAGQAVPARPAGRGR